ncbi:MAG: hypothetical protein WEF50_15845 [Myxococcota bacterium]
MRAARARATAASRLAAACSLALLSLACAGTPAPLGPREPAAFDANDRVDYSATECGAQVLIFLPVMTNDRVARAMALIEQRAGDRYIANVRLRERWTYLVFGEILCTDVVAATYGPLKTGAPPRATDTGR